MTETTSVNESTGPRRSVLRTALSVARVVAINFLVFAICAELACLLYINLTNWPSSKPSYHINDNWFWVDVNPVFGVWHRPNGDFVHKGGCFTVEYTTNSYGARDVERSLHGSHARTVVLGDSFVEGVGVRADDRLSNILEKDTGREHLNFGSGGDFGPLQYALLYKSMAAAFDHDLVLVGVLPDNDFRDMSLSYGRIHHAGRYRPYYADDFSVVYEGQLKPNGGEGFWDHVEAAMRAYLASYQVGQYIYTRLYWYRRSYNPYSGYNDYDDLDLARMKRALEDIKSTADAHGARMAVFLIPRTIDFQRLHETHTDRVGPELERWGQDSGIPIKDLLPEMDARSNGDYQSYFLSCDGHWSRRGATMAAEILEPWLNEKKGS